MREIIETTEYELLQGTPGPEEFLMCSAQNALLAYHGFGATTGCGQEGAEMKIGTEAEIQAEIERLGLKERGSEEG